MSNPDSKLRFSLHTESEGACIHAHIYKEMLEGNIEDTQLILREKYNKTPIHHKLRKHNTIAEEFPGRFVFIRLEQQRLIQNGTSVTVQIPPQGNKQFSIIVFDTHKAKDNPDKDTVFHLKYDEKGIEEKGVIVSKSLHENNGYVEIDFVPSNNVFWVRLRSASLYK